MLVLDAFSSDAIPAHLLTREAIALYRQRFDKDGVLAIHVSNNHLDLVPLVHRLSRDAGTGKSSHAIATADRSIGDQARHMDADHAPSEQPIWNHASLKGAHPASKSELADAPLWTDQRHNLVSVLRLW